MSKIFFTSDNHYSHKNIIDYCSRPFLDNNKQPDVYKMNKVLTDNWNARVKPDDTVFVIGDFCFKNTPAKAENGEGLIIRARDYEKQLNGKIIHLMGNHDPHNGVKAIISGAEIRFGGMPIWMTHNPQHVNQKYPLNLTGHVHQHWQCKWAGYDCCMVNVGVDVWKFYPVTFEEIYSRYKKFTREHPYVRPTLIPE